MSTLYHIVELNQRVPNVNPELFRWKWRAERRCKKLNNKRKLPYIFRYEVHDWLNGRWGIVAMQNQIVPNKES